MGTENLQNKTPVLLNLEESKRKEEIETFATAVKKEFEKQIVGKTFTLTKNTGREISETVTVTVTVTNLSVSAAPEFFLLVREPGSAHATLASFSSILVSPEGTKAITNIMKDKKIPEDIQGKVKEKILRDKETKKV